MANILIDVERRKYPHSGVGFFCSCLEQGIRELVETEGGEHQISFYGVPTSGQVDYYRHRPWHRLYNPATRGRDVLYITHQLQNYFQRSSSSPYCIVTLHDLNFLFEQLSPAQRERRLTIVQHNLERADVIVCISDFVRQTLLEHIALFRLRERVRIEVIYNGLIFAPPIEERPSSLSPEIEGKYLLSIGVLQDKKQQHLLLQMLPYLDEDMHLVLLYSAYHEEYMEVLQDLVLSLDLVHRVHFVQNATTKEKQYLLGHCVAYLHPSIAEGFGIPPIEAMHLGRPVFLSRYTSLPEVGGEEAYYFPSSDPQEMAKALMQGLSDYAKDASKAERLIEWSNRYDYRQMARSYLALIPNK